MLDQLNLIGDKLVDQIGLKGIRIRNESWRMLGSE